MECKDKKCPFHGCLKTRGMEMEGRVVSTKMQNSVVVLVESLVHVHKYERSMRVRSRITAHKPECMDIKVGDKVKLAECRKLSRTKSFVVIAKV